MMEVAELLEFLRGIPTEQYEYKVVVAASKTGVQDVDRVYFDSDALELVFVAALPEVASTEPSQKRGD